MKTTTTRTTRSATRAARGAAVAGLVIALTACGTTEQRTSSAQDTTPKPSQSASAPAPEPDTTPAVEPAVEPASASVLEVSGDGVGETPFGTDVVEATAALTDALGEPDLTVGPTRYSRIPGADGWYETAGDEISPRWRYRVTSVSCWGGFCAIYGGEQERSLQLRGWELADYNRWDKSGEAGEGTQPDVRLSDSGITLGDSWKQLHAAYPQTVVQAAEGASLSVGTIPWTGIFDGAAEWRLSGYWDYEHPSKVPAGSVVTRLSGGEGPEPGCC